MSNLAEAEFSTRRTTARRVDHSAGAECLIVVEGLAKAYDSCQPVLQHIDLTIRRGEAVALIGANGSGKSTLLKSLVGLHEIDAGAISIFGEKFTSHPSAHQKRSIRRQIGFVFQAHSLVRRLSVLSNVIHGQFGLPGAWRAWHQILATDDMRRQAATALDAVGLLDKAHARADQLSGGQQQRVAIARAMVRRPSLLIADEPAASLDPTAGHEVMQQLVDLNRTKGTTLVFTSHDMEHAARYADRIVALKGGRVLLDSPADMLSMREIEEVFR